MTHIEGMTEGDLVADDLATRREDADGGFLAGIGGLAVQLAQHDQPTEVAPPECHEVRMDLPAVRVPPVRTAEHGAGKRMRFVEPVDAVVEPVRANRVCVGIEQYDVRVTRRKHPGVGRLTVAMAAVEPAMPAQQGDIGLRPRPGLRSVPAALIHEDDLVVPAGNGLTHALDQQPGEEQPVARDGDDADRSALHALCVAAMSTASDPDVTVLMPVRNGARYLEAAVVSILAQRLSNFEFIVCDDGSTDATPRELARHAAQDRRIRVLTLPPLGLVAALNRGMQEARGAWVARMDADDVAWPQRLTVQLAVAAAHPEAAGIGSAWRIVDQIGQFGEIVQPPTDPGDIAAALVERNCLAHPTMLLQRQAVITAGGYREAFLHAEDYDLWLRLSEHHPLYAVSEPLLDYREHPGQVSNAALEQRILSELGAQVAARARRRGAADPPTGTAPVNRAWLLSAGATEAEVRSRLIAGALGAAKRAVRARQPAAARAAVHLLYAQNGLRPRTRLHALLIQAAAGLMREQSPPP
jgi:hypothetical protein